MFSQNGFVIFIFHHIIKFTTLFEQFIGAIFLFFNKYIDKNFC